MTKNVPAFIRTQFRQILERVSQNDARFVVTKKGEAKVIILGVDDFLQAVTEPPESLAALQKQARKSGTDKLTLEEIEKRLRRYTGIETTKKYDTNVSIILITS